MKYRLERAGQIYDIDVQQTSDGYVLRGPDGRAIPIRFEVASDGSQRALTPWGRSLLRSARRGAEVWAELDGRRLSARAERLRPSAQSAGGSGALGAVRAPMAGKLLRISVALGDLVQAAQPVAVIEAMKMENELLAPVTGVVVELGATAPASVEKGALVVRLEPR